MRYLMRYINNYMNNYRYKNLPFLFSFNLGKVPIDTTLLNFIFLVFVINVSLLNLFMTTKMRKENDDKDRKKTKQKKTVIQQNKN